MEESGQQSSGTITSRFGEEAFDELVLVFRYLNFQELSVCRTVSKLWYDASLSHWLEAAPPKKLWEEPQDDEGTERATTIAAFLDRFHGGGDRGELSEEEHDCRAIRQFRKFRLDFASAESNEKCEAQWNLLDRFLTKCGPFITYLVLENINLQNPQVFEDVVYSKYTPNLKELQVDSCNRNFEGKARHEEELFNLVLSESDKSYSRKIGRPAFKKLYINLDLNDEDDYGRLPVTWLDLLSHFSELEASSLITLEIDFISSDDLTEMLNAISHVRRADKTNLALSTIHVEREGLFLDGPERLVDFFLVSQLPLKQLDIHIFPKTTAPLVFELINLHSATLQKLCIKVADSGIVWANELEPPFVEHLHKLEIRGKIISSMRFLQKFPNLEVLTLCGPYLRKLIVTTTEEEMEGVVIPSLKKFTYKYKEICGPEEVRKIAKWMPSLTSLKLAVTNDGLRVACESWPFMESMKLAVGLAGDDNRLERGQSLIKYIPVNIPRSISRNNGEGLRKTTFELVPFARFATTTRRRLVADSLKWDFSFE